jgi:hypothetical protein
MSSCDQASAILPSASLKNEMRLTETLRPVAVMPLKGPWWLVGRDDLVAHGDAVALADEVVDAHLEVGKRGAQRADRLLQPLAAGRLTRQRGVRDKLFGDELIGQRDVALREPLIEPPADDLFVT